MSIDTNHVHDLGSGLLCLRESEELPVRIQLKSRKEITMKLPYAAAPCKV